MRDRPGRRPVARCVAGARRSRRPARRHGPHVGLECHGGRDPPRAVRRPVSDGRARARKGPGWQGTDDLYHRRLLRARASPRAPRGGPAAPDPLIRGRRGGVRMARPDAAIDRARSFAGTAWSRGRAESTGRRPLCEGGPRLLAEVVRGWRNRAAELVARPDRSADCAGPGQIHRAPEQAWTLAQLASRAAMSRTAFAQRFRALVGQTPVSYLAAWRMQKAAYLLEMGTLSIAQIAEQVGYTSELAFAKAFRRLMGMPPGAHARQHTRR